MPCLFHTASLGFPVFDTVCRSKAVLCFIQLLCCSVGSSNLPLQPYRQCGAEAQRKRALGIQKSRKNYVRVIPVSLHNLVFAQAAAFLGSHRRRNNTHRLAASPLLLHRKKPPRLTKTARFLSFRAGAIDLFSGICMMKSS